MTEEGKAQLDKFLQAKGMYEAEKPQFEQYAIDWNPEFARWKICENNFIIIGTLTPIVFILIILFSRGNGAFYALCLFVVYPIGTWITNALHPHSDVIKGLVSDYMKSKEHPEEEEDLAYRVFTGAKVYSDLPLIQRLINDKLISKVDIDDLDIDTDDDYDSDGDGDD